VADPLTHALLGAACAPEHPILGAFFGLAPDAPLIPMNIYTIAKHGKLATGQESWDSAPAALNDLYDVLHGVFAPAAVLFMCWFFFPAAVPFALAYLSHVFIDAPLHKTTSFLFPLRGANLALGKNWWEDWRIPAGTISGSLAILILRSWGLA